MKKIMGILAVAGLASAATAQSMSIVAGTGTYVSIQTTGTRLGGEDDNSFAWRMTGTNNLLTSPDVFLGTNGYVTQSIFTAFGNGPLPSSGSPIGFYIAWDDWHSARATGQGVWAQNTGSSTIFEWRTGTFGSGAGEAVFQMEVFYNGGNGIQAQYRYVDMLVAGTSDNGGSATCGAIKNLNPLDQVTHSQDLAVLTNGTVLNVMKIPTPGSLALLGLGGLAAARRRR